MFLTILFIVIQWLVHNIFFILRDKISLNLFNSQRVQYVTCEHSILHPHQRCDAFSLRVVRLNRRDVDNKC